MQSQKALGHEVLSRILTSDSDKVQYVAIANVLGEIVDIHHSRNTSTISREVLSENLRKATLATNVLTFENIKIMVLSIGQSNTIIINLAVDTIIVGMSKGASMSDFARVLSLVSQSGF